MKQIYTLGTDRRSEEDFSELLHYYDIETVVDVRSYPKSRLPLFTRENLRIFLDREGLSYIFLGAELGGFRRGGYEAYSTTWPFMEGITRLERIAQGGNAVIICSEKMPWKCHRRWIARELHRRGWMIEHIIDKGKVWIPK